MNAEYKEARERAKRTIETKWQEVASLRTLGWGGPIQAVEARFPFMHPTIDDIVGRIVGQLPIFIFQSRELPPSPTSHIELAVPYRDHTGNEFNCRLVTTQELPPSQVKLLGDFAQALWFCIAQQMLPPPMAGTAFEDTLTAWTGEEFFRL